MTSYIESGNLPINEYLEKITDDIKRETKNMPIYINNFDDNDTIIFNDFMYKTNHKIPSLTEIYIDKKKFKDKEKIKMLYGIAKDSNEIVMTNYNDYS